MLKSLACYVGFILTLLQISAKEGLVRVVKN